MCPYCRENVEVASEFIGQKVECPHCVEEFTVPGRPPEKKQAAVAPLKYRYTTIVIRLDLKGFVFRKEDLLQGLAEESADQFTRLGNEGWELVSVLPCGSGKSHFLMPGGKASRKDSAIAFFKRVS